MSSSLLHRGLHRIAAITLVTLATMSVAWSQDLEVTVPAEDTVIGKDLVLELRLPAAAGSDRDAVTVTVTASEGTGAPLLDEPYPLRAGDAPGQFTWSAPTRPDTHPGDYTLSVTVSSPAGEASWEGPVAVDFGKDWSAERITFFIENRGRLLFFGLVFFFGILMSATPCIYPMIPITLAVIGAQTQDRTLAKGFLLALTYGLGLAIVYGIIGVISATVFSGITAFLQSPVVLVPIAALMVTMAFAMFGAFELEAPAFLRNRLQGAGGGQAGIIGAFIAGMVAGLVASPCVGPFLAALLVWVGTTGDVLLGFWTLFIFGLGLSALLVAVGTFPSAMSSMPQSGGWMEQVKRGMGLLLLYMAFFFVRPPLVLPADIFWPLLGATTIVVAVFLGAFDRLDATSQVWDRARKALGILALLTGVWLMAREVVPPLLPAPTPVQPAPVMVAGAAGGSDPVAAAPLPDKVQWELIRTGENVQGFIDEKIALAKSTGKPIMIDFWATWCVYCKKLDKVVWVEPEVVEESLRFITIKVDATDPDDDDMTAVKDMFKVPGLPTVAFIDSSGRVLHGKTLSGWHEADEFLATMKSIE
jgi:thiol:disulfide interchange protein DsbD